MSEAGSGWTRCTRIFLALGVVGLSAAGCRKEVPRSEARVSPTAAPSSAGLGPGAFHLEELGRAVDGSTRYLARAEGGAAPCEFEIDVGNATAPPDSAFALASASLIRRAASDCTRFLRELAPVLGFEGDLPAPPAASRLAVSLAVLGSNLSRGTGKEAIAGSFQKDPPGRWISTKLFLADGEGEVFLNLDPTGRMGEFAIKDDDYATIVVTELAKVLLPELGGSSRGSR